MTQGEVNELFFKEMLVGLQDDFQGACDGPLEKFKEDLKACVMRDFKECWVDAVEEHGVTWPQMERLAARAVKTLVEYKRRAMEAEAYRRETLSRIAEDMESAGLMPCVEVFVGDP